MLRAYKEKGIGYACRDQKAKVRLTYTESLNRGLRLQVMCLTSNDLQVGPITSSVGRYHRLCATVSTVKKYRGTR